VTNGSKTEFPTLEAFYADRPERRRSGEADFGVHWTERPARPFPVWRVSYIQATGEVYAVCLTGPGLVKVLGTVPPDQDDRHVSGDWARGGTYYRTLDRILHGWAELEPRNRRLSWVKARLNDKTRLEEARRG
jgi:hypothetical protein